MLGDGQKSAGIKQARDRARVPAKYNEHLQQHHACHTKEAARSLCCTQAGLRVAGRSRRESKQQRPAFSRLLQLVGLTELAGGASHRKGFQSKHGEDDLRSLLTPRLKKAEGKHFSVLRLVVLRLVAWSKV